MGYALGVDLDGRSVTAATSTPDGDRADGSEVVAARASGTERADRLLELVGDPVHRTGDPIGAESALAALVQDCVGRVTRERGSAPDTVMVAHPSGWGPYRSGLLLGALAACDLPPVDVMPDTPALVGHAAAVGLVPAAADALVAVLDVREERLTVGVVRVGRRTTGRATPVGAPRAVDDLGTGDVADAVLAHVREVVGGDVGRDPGTWLGREAAQRLRADCAAAAEELVIGTAVTVPCPVPDGTREVRVVAADLEERLRPRAARAVAAAAAAVASAVPGGVDAVLLTGRLAAMPLLTELVAGRFEAPISVLPLSDAAVACGAAVAAGSITRTAPGRPSGRHADDPAPERRPRRARARRPRDRRPLRAVAVAGTAVLALGILAFAVTEEAFAVPAGSGGTYPPVAVSTVRPPAVPWSAPAPPASRTVDGGHAPRVAAG